MDSTRRMDNNGRIGQFDSEHEHEDNKGMFGEMSIAQYKSSRAYFKLVLIVLIVSVILLISMAAGLIAVHIRNTNLQNDLQQLQMLTDNLSSSISDVVGDNEERDSAANVEKQMSKPSNGAVFTRWGNITCPATSEFVYEGLVGGSYYSHSGGAAQYLCLPDTPAYGAVTPSVAEYRSTIYNTELQYPAFTPLEHMQHQDAACSVCRTLSGRSSVLMVPARNVCPKGWTQEYVGYLMTAMHEHKRTEYLCVDSNPTPLRNGARDQNGALLYPVEAHCDESNMPCPPYVQGYELTCAVCSK